MERVLTDVLGRTLEEAAFIFVEPTQGSADEPSDLAVSLEWSSSQLFGRLVLVGERDLATYVAANLMGMEPEDEGAAAAGPDALKELLSIVAGIYLEERTGGEGFLGIPALEAWTATERAAHRDAAAHVVLLEADDQWVLEIWEVEA